MFWSKKKINTVLAEERGGASKSLGWRASTLKQLVFLPFGQSSTPDLSVPVRLRPAARELANASNIYISTDPTDVESSKIGAWLFHPEKVEPTKQPSEAPAAAVSADECWSSQSQHGPELRTLNSGLSFPNSKVEKLTENDTVVLYLHGNDSHRGEGNRLNLYSFLLRLGYHVLAIDYRGFGDSSPVELSESTVVSDARTALSWITKELGDKAKVVVWGHSLGSGIACHMVAEVDKDSGGSSSPVSGLVLEAPFNSMYNEVMTFKAARALSVVTDVHALMEQGNILFESERWLPAIKCPVLMFHAEDDDVVPFHLGLALYQRTLQAGKTNIRFVSYPVTAGLGHCGLCMPGRTAREVRNFMENIGNPKL